MALRAPITITDAAAERVQALLREREKPSVGIRVGVKKGGCSGLSYVIEYADDLQKFDEVVEDKGIKVIIDGMNCLDKDAIKKLGIIYKGIGR